MNGKPVVLTTRSEALIGHALFTSLSRDDRAAGYAIVHPHKLPDALAFINCDLRNEQSVIDVVQQLATREDNGPVSVEQAHEKLGWNPKHRLRDTIPAIVEPTKRKPKVWRKLNGLPHEENEPA